MAQAQQPERGGEAEFVRAIVTDPKNVPDVMRLYGYLGASSEENHERLYLNRTSPTMSRCRGRRSCIGRRPRPSRTRMGGHAVGQARRGAVYGVALHGGLPDGAGCLRAHAILPNG